MLLYIQMYLNGVVNLAPRFSVISVTTSVFYAFEIIFWQIRLSFFMHLFKVNVGENLMKLS